MRSQLACSAKRLPAARRPADRRPAAGPRRGCPRHPHPALALVGDRGEGRRPTPRPCWPCSRSRRFWELPIVDGHDRGAADAPVRRGRDPQGPGPLRPAAGPGAGAEHGKALMAGFEAAYAGRSLAGIPQSLAEALARFSGQSVTLGLRQGKPEAVAEALAVLSRRAGRPGQAAPVPPDPGRGPRAGRRSGPAAAGLPLARQRPAGRRAGGPGELRRSGHRRPRCSRPMAASPTTCMAAAQNLLVARQGWAIAVPPGDRRDDDRPPDRPPRDRREAPSLRTTRGSTTWPPATSARSGRRPRPSSRPRSPAWPAWSAPAPASPSRASRSSSTSAPAATRSSARGARSGPT